MADDTVELKDLAAIVKDSRIAIRDVVADLNGLLLTQPKSGREIALAKTKLQEARMWLGQAQLAEGLVEPLKD